MTLTQEQIEKISKSLSKIRLSSAKVPEDIKWIIAYMDLLNEVDTKNVKSTISVIEKENTLRTDNIEQNVDPLDLLECTNQKVIWRQIAVSNIMK